MYPEGPSVLHIDEGCLDFCFQANAGILANLRASTFACHRARFIMKMKPKAIDVYKSHF
jgi:hypothetical protein